MSISHCLSRHFILFFLLEITLLPGSSPFTFSLLPRLRLILVLNLWDLCALHRNDNSFYTDFFFFGLRRAFDNGIIGGTWFLGWTRVLERLSGPLSAPSTSSTLSVSHSGCQRCVYVAGKLNFQVEILNSCGLREKKTSSTSSLYLPTQDCSIYSIRDYPLVTVPTTLKVERMGNSFSFLFQKCS